jgi:hypothetical protein
MTVVASFSDSHEFGQSVNGPARSAGQLNDRSQVRVDKANLNRKVET